MNNRFLYRGINKKLFEITKGILAPKNNKPFSYTFKANGTIKADGSATCGPSEQNAVLRHELRQEGFPTSGISTTPVYERARFYATGGGKHRFGYIFKIDRALLQESGVREYIVSDWIPYPSIQEDEEVILVTENYGPLPEPVIVDIISVSA